MLTFEVNAFKYFANISVQISPNNKNLDIFKIKFKKLPNWIFQTPRKWLNLMSNIRSFFMKHPVYFENIENRLCKYCTNTVQILCKYFTNIVQILHRYCVNIVYYEYFANIV